MKRYGIMLCMSILCMFIPCIFWSSLHPTDNTDVAGRYHEEIMYQNPVDGTTIAGSLTIRHTGWENIAVFLIPGRGEYKRGSKEHPFVDIVESLIKQHVSSLHIDKRGSGKSGGIYEESTQQDFIGDVIAGINYLKSKPFINKKRIGLLGYGEGAAVATQVALKTNDVAFLILMAPDGLPADKALIEQTKSLMAAKNMPKDIITQVNTLQKELIDVAKTNKDPNLAKPIMSRIVFDWRYDLSKAHKERLKIPEPISQRHSDNDEHLTLINSLPFRSLLPYDPAQALRKIKIPMLVLHGRHDLHTPPRMHLPIIRSALKKSSSPNYKIIDDLSVNHAFQPMFFDKETQTYQVNFQGRKKSTAEFVLKDLTAWINNLYPGLPSPLPSPKKAPEKKRKSIWRRLWEFVF